MKPKITFKCYNEKCEHYAKELELNYSTFFGAIKGEHEEDYWAARLKHCRSCYKNGDVNIEHGNRTFSDIETFEEYVLGITKETKLLKKLIDRGVAGPEEMQQFDELMRLLQDTKCSCCGKLLIETPD